MFPNENEELFKTPSLKRTKSFLFDFKKGDFITIDGKVKAVDEIEALKVWIEKVIRTEKFKYEVYKTGDIDEYGIRLFDFINNAYNYSFVKVEIEREVKEALLKNDDILTVNNFIFGREKRTLVCEFTCNTVYGQIESVVRI